MINRAVLYALLVIVAAAAAVLSFAALRDLALLCGFDTSLAWLLPIVLDAGAAAGSLAWLVWTGRPRRFGRHLTLVLLGASVVGNALSHFLTAFSVAPAWWVVVAVSAVAPAVLGAVVHLATLTARPGAAVLSAADETPRSAPAVAAAAHEPTAPIPAGVEPPSLAPAGPPPVPAVRLVRDVVSAATIRQREVRAPVAAEDGLEEQVRAMLDAGAGSPSIAKQLGMERHQVRPIVERIRPPVPRRAQP